MDTDTQTRPRLHPVLWIAAASVTVASLVAIAAMTGVLPGSQASAPPAVVASATPSDVAQPITQVAPQVGNTASAAPENAKPVRHKPARKTEPQPARYDSDAYAAAQGYPEPVRVAQADVPAPPVCNLCGVVEAVRPVTQEAPSGSGIGAVAGGVLGGALGNGVGQGNGRTLATLAGIVGGAFAGNKVEKTMHKTTHYEVRVRFDDGASRTFTQNEAPSWHEGDRVKFNNGTLVSAG